MPQIKIDDIELYYEQSGSGEDLVLVAGLSSDSSAWGSLVDKLSQHFRVTVFDNRGVGRSSQPDGVYRIEQMAGDCIGLLAKLGISSAHFVGHSLGGQIVQEIAASYPECVNKVVVVTSTYHYPEYAQLHFQNIADLMVQEVSGEQILRVIFPWVFSAGYLQDKNLVDTTLSAFLSALYQQSYAGYCGQIAALRNYDSLVKLPQISAPTLLITGDNDLLIPDAQTEQMLVALPFAYRAKIAACGHIPQIEAPERLLSLVLNFLS